MELWDFDAHGEQRRDLKCVHNLHISIPDHESRNGAIVAGNQHRGIRLSNNRICGDGKAGDGAVRGG